MSNINAGTAYIYNFSITELEFMIKYSDNTFYDTRKGHVRHGIACFFRIKKKNCNLICKQKS